MSQDLERRIIAVACQLVAEASVVSEGKASNYSPTRGGKPESRPPTGDDWSMADRFRHRFVSCRTVLDLERAVKASESELVSYRRQRSRPMTPDMRRYWILQAVGDRPVDVAAAVKCDPAYVRQLRTKHGLDTTTGKRRHA